MRRSGRVAFAAVLLSLILAGLAAFGAHRAEEVEAARNDALAAAETRLPKLLSYRATHLPEDLKRALAQTTGSFTADYRKILNEVVRPTASKRGISTTATVSAAGVVSGGRDSVVILVFMTQTTTARDDRSSVSGSRVEVTLERAGGSWKIAALKPV